MTSPRSLAAALHLALLVGPAGGAGAVFDPDAWTRIETDHLLIYTDAEVERGLEVAYDLERFRAVLAHLAPALDLEPLAPTTVFAFRDAESFAPYKGRPDRPGAVILGQFLAHPDGNFLTLDADPRFVGSTAVLYHEYVHYVVRTNIPEVPLWFNEGLAEYYSTFETDGEWAVVGRPVERHTRWLLRRGGFDLGRVLEATGSDRHDVAEAGELYAVSWLLVHHLMSGDDERLGKMATFIGEVAGGTAPYRAFREAFGVHPRDLEADLLESLRREALREARIPLGSLPAVRGSAWRAKPADVLSALGDLLAAIGRVDAAESHYFRAFDHETGHPRSHAGIGHLRDRAGRHDEAEIWFQDAARLGADDPLSSLRLGRHFLLGLGSGPVPDREARDARALAARRAFARALDQAPGFVEARALFGYAHAFGEVDPAAGVDDLRRAIARDPTRVEWKLQLVQLLLRADRPDDAEAFLERSASVDPEAEWARRAEGEIARWRALRAAGEALEVGDVEAAIGYYTQALEVTHDPALHEAILATIARLEERDPRPASPR